MRAPIIHQRTSVAWAGLTLFAFLGTVRLDGQEGFRFRTSVEFINVTATVVDRAGRFVPGLRQADFTIYDDERQVEVTHFSAERVPVSLGMVLDTIGSMAGEKITNARAAIERFVDRLLTPEDEVFVYGFSNRVERLQEWTTDPDAVRAALRRVHAVGGTAMYDAVLEAIPVTQRARHRKRAIVLISDGNDTNSRSDIGEVRRIVRESEVLVYAVGIDGDGESAIIAQPPTFPIPIPFPIPGRGRPPTQWPRPPQYPPSSKRAGGGERLNASALREITDSSGGRTEVVRSSRDLDPATTSIAAELSQQYQLGYTSPGHRDGRWHAIRVEVRDGSLRVRARRGYLAPDQPTTLPSNRSTPSAPTACHNSSVRLRRNIVPMTSAAAAAIKKRAYSSSKLSSSLTMLALRRSRSTMRNATMRSGSSPISKYSPPPATAI
jgi:Ca-activated chloride channel family protein